MWQKVKGVLAFIGAVISVALFTLLLFLLRRRGSVEQGSGGDAERDRCIQEGLGECQDRIERCEEHLQRAEDILRNAIGRSRKG